MNGYRHPSLDNLRRPKHNNSRSYSQLLSEFSGSPRSGGDGDEESVLSMAISYVTAFAALVCVGGLLITLCFLYLTVKPFSENLYRRLAATIGSSSFLDAMALLLPNVRLYLTGDSDVPSPVGTSILISNHLMDCDWWSVMMLGRCVGLRGSIKVFLRNECLELAKKSLDLAIRTENSSPKQMSKSVSFNNRTTSSAAAHKNAHAYGHHARKVSPILSFAARLLHSLLDFPLLSGENNSYIEDREELFSLLKSFAMAQGTPVHLLLFPEGWSLHNGADRKAVVAKSNDFAKREGRPQLKHLLLPRTTGFSASLEKLRESSPVVYDVTMAYRGYDGTIEPSQPLTPATLWRMLRRNREIHIRIKRYSMEEVLQDASWLDKQWAGKDRLLGHFSRHQQFPQDSRGFCRHRVFDTRDHGMENSILALLRLLVIPCTMPVLLLLSIPIFWTVLWLWILYKAYQMFFAPHTTPGDDDAAATRQQSHTPAGPDSATGTPFFPATPFASPSISNWRDMLGNACNSNESPARR